MRSQEETCFVDVCSMVKCCGADVGDFGGGVETVTLLWLGDIMENRRVWVRVVRASEVISRAGFCGWCFGRQGGRDAGVSE